MNIKKYAFRLIVAGFAFILGIAAQRGIGYVSEAYWAEEYHCNA